MIDDLVTQGVTEPYRMFTSRAEYRLTLRADNADQRLTGKGIAIRCVGPERQRQFETKMTALEQARTLANSLSTTPNEAEKHGITVSQDGQRRTAFELMSHPDIGFTDVARMWPQLREIAPSIAEQLEIDAKYAVYLDRQAADVAAFRRDEGLELSDALDYTQLSGLSMEMRQKLQSIRPRTIGQAGRIDGVTPAALTLLAAHIRRGKNARIGSKSA
jgi:tRNA uridine 5-carboxymethylaminomethyl modification enzyme